MEESTTTVFASTLKKTNDKGSLHREILKKISKSQKETIKNDDRSDNNWLSNMRNEEYEVEYIIKY